MARSLRHDVPPHAPAEDRQVAHQVPDLVTDELVVEAQGAGGDSLLVQNHGVLQARPQRQPLRLQRLLVPHESERPGRGQLLDEGVVDGERCELAPDQRVVELDGGGDPQVVGRGTDVVAAVRAVGGHGAGDLPHPRRPILLPYAGFPEHVQEGAEAAVHDRDLGAGHLDDQVVDAQGRHGRQDVLHRTGLRPVGGQRRAQLRVPDRLQGGHDLGIAIQVRAPEPDPRIHLRGQEPDARGLPRVDPDSLQLRRPSDGLLSWLAHSPPFCPFCPSISRSSSRTRFSSFGSRNRLACARSASA